LLFFFSFFGFDSATKLTHFTADIERCYDMQSALEIRGVSGGINYIGAREKSFAHYFGGHMAHVQ
jgi:hypothetical protein